MAKPAKPSTKAKGRSKSSSDSSSNSSSNSSTKAAAVAGAAFTKKRKISVDKPSTSEPLLASDFDESSYLKGTDIGLGEEEMVTIDQVTAAMLGEEGQQKKKPILSFREIEKKLVANKTNREVLKEALGNDMSRWPGHKVILFSQMVSFKGTPRQAMRLRMPSAKREGGSGLRRK